MSRRNKTDRSEHRPSIEELESPREQHAARRRPSAYRNHTRNVNGEFMQNISANYSPAYEQPIHPQYPPRSAPWLPPQVGVPWPPAPPQPMPSPATSYAGNWPQVYPTTQVHGQQIPAQYPAVHHYGGFPHAELPYPGPFQGTYAPVHRPSVPHSFQQPHLPRQFNRTEGCHDFHYEQDGFATQHSRHRRGHFEHHPDPELNRPEQPHCHKHRNRTPRYTQATNHEPSPGYDDGRAGDDRQQQKPINTDKPSSTRPKTRRATSEDATKHGIPPGYNLQKWDPDENPITLLGSVFDACSIGKWIFDSTFNAYDACTAEVDKSEELWFSLIQVAGRLRVSANFISQSVTFESVEQQRNVEVVKDFIESGERLMERFQELLRSCEKAIYDSDDTDDGNLLGKAGALFVQTIFSSEKYSARMDSFMQQLRLWNHRWDANCDLIIDVKPDTEQALDEDVGDGEDSVH